MASATNSRVKRGSHVPSLEDLAERYPIWMECGIPLLALRVPDFERVAWRAGKRAAHRLERSIGTAFSQAAGRVLRYDDCVRHDAGSDVFAALMYSSPRSGRVSRPGDCRAALARMAAEVTPAAGAPVECGWTIVPPGTRPHLQKHVALALKRGVVERQRYEFFAIVGHELRTPITSIRAYLDTVIDTAPASGAQRRFLRRARTETLRSHGCRRDVRISMLDLSAATADPHCFLDEAIAEARDAVDPHARPFHTPRRCAGVASMRGARFRPVRPRLREPAGERREIWPGTWDRPRHLRARHSRFDRCLRR